jgi:hypothetical protein
MRILRPGFSVVSPEYAVGLVRPRPVWSFPDEPEEHVDALPRPVAASS